MFGDGKYDGCIFCGEPVPLVHSLVRSKRFKVYHSGYNKGRIELFKYRCRKCKKITVRGRVQSRRSAYHERS